MTKTEKTCYNCGNPDCNIPRMKKRVDVNRHYEVFDLITFECRKHHKWRPMSEKIVPPNCGSHVKVPAHKPMKIIIEIKED